MARGRSICNVLKQIRKQIADVNGIGYAPTPCRFKGECRGTCPACEAEVRFIERELDMRRMAGKAVTLLGLSVGMASLTACHETPKTSKAKNKTETVVERTRIATGDIDGDIAFPSGSPVRTMVKFTPPEIAVNHKQKRNRHGKTLFSSPENIQTGDIEIKPNTIITDTTDVCNATDTIEYKAVPSYLITGEIQAPAAIRNKKGDDPNNPVYSYVENSPQFQGGLQALTKYIADNLRYPNGNNDIHGRVVVNFIVERDGSLSDVKILRSVDPLLDKEALRIVNSMPKWLPGTHDGKVVRVEHYVAVKF